MAQPGIPERIEKIVTPSLEAMGYEVVRVQLTGGAGRTTLQVMAEPADGRGMTVRDCTEISHTISALLDVEDPIPGGFTLEVSSPGIDRPLVRPRDFERFAGHVAKIETSRPIEGRKRFRGLLGGITDAGVRIVVEDQETEVPFEAIQRAKLVVTDKLLAEAAAAAGAGET